MTLRLLPVVALFIAMTVNPLKAHHSESAQFDPSKPVKITGTIKAVEWTNPHIWIYVDVTEATGRITTWGFSGGAPGMLIRRGITKNVLKIGDVVNVEGSQARDGSNNASVRRVTFSDGRNVFAGTTEEGAGRAF
jgi:uncharacterized protein DUF6152